MSVHPRRARVARLAGVAALTLTAFAVPASTAAATGGRPLIGSAAPTAGRQITLITGDRALVSTDAAGHASATVLPGPLADPDGYVTRSFRGDLYVVPARAMALISQGRLDEELFNVSALARDGYDDAATGQLPLLATYDGQVEKTGQAPTAPDGTTVTATVFGPGVAFAGSYSWPHLHQQPAATPVTLTNTGDAAVTFDLAIVGATGEDGQPLAKRTMSVGAPQVTVPAHGTADVPVIVDPAVQQSAAGYGNVGGRLVATAADGTTVTTAVGAYLEPHMVAVTLHLVDRRGLAPATPSFVDVVDADRLKGQRFTTFATDPVLKLREGRYSIAAVIASRDDGTTGANGLVKSIAFLGDPEVVVNNDDTDRTITYDARDAVRQQVTGERPLEAQSTAMQYIRDWDGVHIAGGYSGGKQVDEVYAARTTPVTDGGFELGTYYRMYAPELSLRSTGGIALTPEYVVPSLFAAVAPAKLDGSGSADLVTAGAGTAAELAAAGVEGKIVLVKDAGDATKVLTAAAAAKAKAVLFSRTAAGRWITSTSGAMAIPGITLAAADADALRAALAAGPVTLAWEAVAASPYVYNLAYADSGMTRPDVPKQVRDRDLARVDERIFAMRTDRGVIDIVRASRAGFPLVVAMVSDKFGAPLARTAYFTPDVQWQSMAAGAGIYDETMIDVPRTYTAGQVRKADWYAAPVRTTGTRRADYSPEHIAERQEQLIGVAMLHYGDTDPDHYSGGGFFGDVGYTELLRDGVHVGTTPVPYGLYTVPDGDGAYELRVTTMRLNPTRSWYSGWNLFYRTETAFRFHSARPADDGLYALPLLVPAYDIPLDLHNLAPATASFQVGFGAAGQRDYDARAITAAQA